MGRTGELKGCSRFSLGTFDLAWHVLVGPGFALQP